MQCPYCGQQHPDGAEFCPVTGNRLSLRHNSSRSFYLGLGVFSGLLITVSLGMLLLNNRGLVQRAINNITNLPAGNSTKEVNPSSNDPQQNLTEGPTARPFATSTQVRRTSTPAPTVTPVITETSIVSSYAYEHFDWSSCHAAYRTRLRPGDMVEIGNFYSPFGYHVLTGPYQNRTPGGDLSPGDRALIINGPSCSNKWIWWIIAVENKNVSGWFPEGDTNSFWLLPVDQHLETGLARISNQVGGVNLRHSPGYKSKNDYEDVVVEVPSGEIVHLLDGPQVVEGLNWWYVEWNGHEGWVAEKTGTGRLILVFNP